MKRFLAGMMFGFLLAVGAFLAWQVKHAPREPKPAAELINQNTKAREVRELKPGRDPDQRFVPMHVERH